MMKLIALLSVFCLAFACTSVAEDRSEGLPGDNTYDPPTEAPDAGNCGEQQEAIELVEVVAPPDMLIVLDRSISMSTPISGTPLTRWEVMEDALTALTNDKQSVINFGLMVFPSDDTCGVSAGALVEPALNSATEVQAELEQYIPGGATPAKPALTEALSIFTTLSVNPHGRFVLFAADGEPNCYGGPDETVAAIADLAAAGVDTFVLGLGSGVGEETLNDAAQAGGQAKASSPYYYQTDDATELATALDEIALTVVQPSCSYELTEIPPDPDNVTVSVGGQPVPRDASHVEGWDYHPDTSTITLFGSYCDDIELATVGSVEFIFGCTGPIVK